MTNTVPFVRNAQSLPSPRGPSLPRPDAAKGSLMKRHLNCSLVLAAALLPLPGLVSPATAQAVTKPRQEMVLSIGRGQLINVAGRMTDVFVADEKVADVQIKSTTQLYVMAKAAGVTTIYASDSTGAVIWSANIRVGSNIDTVDQMLHVAMPDSQIAVSTFGSDTVLLTGTIPSPEDAAEAQRLVSAFMGKATNVITRLRTATPLQVNLQVRIAEVSRSLVRSLGSNLTTIDGTGGVKFGYNAGRTTASFVTTDPRLPLGIGNQVQGWTQDPTAITATNPLGWVQKPGSTITPLNGVSTIAGLGKLFGLDILGTLDAGETVGLVTTLAQPNLTAISGETADFLAGGEFPVLSSQGLGTTQVEFKRYGVSLSYTPTVMSGGRISLRVRPEVSELSSDGAVSLNGFTIPALTVRRAETTVELGSGQSFMIAGLLKNTTRNSIQKMPGAGDLPILGSLFRSTSFQRGETELVIVVTPYLVKPVDASAIKLPTDGYQSANELQRILGNMQSDGRSAKGRPMPTEAPATQSSVPAGKGAAAPSIGAADKPADDDAPAVASARIDPKRKGGSDADAGAQPGFSLK